jgi:hypothetical protein
MSKFWQKWVNASLSIALFSAFTATATGLAFAAPQASSCIQGFSLENGKCVKEFTFQEGATTFTVPESLTAIEVEVVGAAGGNGGLDCGDGCFAAQSGQVGSLTLKIDDAAGKVLKIYPGGDGGDGASDVSGKGGGAGGRSTYNNRFDGGTGGNAGATGTSGAGAGGGAASVLVIGTKEYIAAGAGGGGGAANSEIDGSTWGDTAEKYVSSGNRGGDGKSSTCAFFCDGAGGGGGGAGVIGGAGGLLYRSPTGLKEAAGFGGSAGTNTPVSGLVTASEYVDWEGAGRIVIRYAAPVSVKSFTLLSNAKTGATEHRFELIANSNAPFSADSIEFSGSATEQADFKATIISKKITKAPYTYTIGVTQLGSTKIQGELIASAYGVSSASIDIDQIAPEATVSLQADTAKTASHVYDVRFDKAAIVTPASFKPADGSAKGCVIGSVIGSGTYYQVSLDSCKDGKFGIAIVPNGITDAYGNRAPATVQASELSDKTSPVTQAETTPGTIPDEFVKAPVEKVFGSVSDAAQQALAELGVYAPMAQAPVVSFVTDLTSAQPGTQLDYQTSQQVYVGSSIKLGLNVSAELAANSDLIAFMQTGNTWQYLGRTSFNNNQSISEAFGIAEVGSYKLRLAVIGKDVQTNISMVSGFGKSLPIRPNTAVTEEQTLIGDQQVNLTINAVVGPDGAPKIVEDNTNNAPVIDPIGNLLDLTLPTLTVGQPVANPGIGATGDDNAPSVPFDPLGSPEAVKAVVQHTATAVAVVSSVAAAAGAAAGAAGAAGGSSSSSSSSSSNSSNNSSSASQDSSNQDTEMADGSITTIDATAEAFTSTTLGWGDRIPVFRFKIFTFLDKFTHNLTIRLAKFSPVIAKIVNDGAYLRSIFGSFYLVFPAAGIALATIALQQPSVELSPPIWQLFIAIAVLGLFDAFSGLLATTIFVIGMFDSYGIESLADIRMMLGVLVVGFGPALIAVAFRQIRKHFETNFGYFWERLVDIAVLTFFTGWTVSSMVSTLPALAGRTLSAANHVADFGFYLSLAIIVRILFEEFAARVYPSRLDKINPTEVPDPSLMQKMFSTALRLGVFVFVTAAFMGNTWQVWVGSIIFILPNILSWIEDRLPNSPFIWRLIPSGVPGLAFSLIVASYSSVFIHQWLGDHPDFSQYSFMLMPIPMFIVGLLALFGREGKDGEDRPIKHPKLRWVYRLGGIVVLLLTVKLAGVI